MAGCGAGVGGGCGYAMVRVMLVDALVTACTARRKDRQGRSLRHRECHCHVSRSARLALQRQACGYDRHDVARTRARCV